MAKVDKKQVVPDKPEATVKQPSQQQIPPVKNMALASRQDEATNVIQKVKKAEFPISETLNGETINQSESRAVDSTETDNTNAIIALADTSEQASNAIENEAALDNANESIGSSAISDSEDELLADPSDYSVFKNKTIEIQAAETLGHYAEWLQLRASRLRRINSMRYGTPVVVGRRLKLDFSRVTPEQFEQERVAYHRTLQGEFFEQFQINGTDKYKLRRGQSIWVLANRKYKIPIWLLRQYNPDLDLNKVRRGTIITFPKIEVRSTVETTG